MLSMRNCIARRVSSFTRSQKTNIAAIRYTRNIFTKQTNSGNNHFEQARDLKLFQNNNTMQNVYFNRNAMLTNITGNIYDDDDR
jgi:hypothetical protein